MISPMVSVRGYMWDCSQNEIDRNREWQSLESEWTRMQASEAQINMISELAAGAVETGVTAAVGAI